MLMRSGSCAVVTRRNGCGPPGVNVDDVVAGQADAPSGGTKAGDAMRVGEEKPMREGYQQFIRSEAFRANTSVSDKVGCGKVDRGGGEVR